MEQFDLTGREIIREGLIRQGIPRITLDIEMTSLSDSTLKSYDGALKKWAIFCKESIINLYKPTVQDLLIFLTDLYKKGLSESSINAIRSAISLITQEDLARDPRVKRFF